MSKHLEPPTDRGLVPLPVPEDDSGSYMAAYDDEDEVVEVAEHVQILAAPRPVEPRINFDVPDVPEEIEDLDATDPPPAEGMKAKMNAEITGEATARKLVRRMSEHETAPLPVAIDEADQPEADPGPVETKAPESTDAAAASESIPPAETQSTAPEPQPEPVAYVPARPRRKLTRIEALAARAVRPRSAVDAARAAAMREAGDKHVRPKHPAASTNPTSGSEPTRVSRRPDVDEQLREVLTTTLSAAAQVYVLGVNSVTNREIERALWRSHRAKFLGDGDLEHALAAGAVLRALDHVPAGHLFAARVVCRGKDYLVWVDLDSRTVVTAFPDGHVYAH